VYERCCALPPHALDGLAAMVQCVSRLRGVPRSVHAAVAAQLLRYARALPVREEQARASTPAPPLLLGCAFADAVVSPFRAPCAALARAPLAAWSARC
jgi:acetyl-CoA acetyltransferase